MLVCFFSTSESVASVDIESGFNDTLVEEATTVELTVKITSQCASVKWYKDGERIVPCNKYTTFDDNGFVHTLAIENFLKADEGTYTFVCRGKTKSAKVYLRDH